MRFSVHLGPSGEKPAFYDDFVGRTEARMHMYDTSSLSESILFKLIKERQRREQKFSIVEVFTCF